MPYLTHIVTPACISELSGDVIAVVPCSHHMFFGSVLKLLKYCSVLAIYLITSLSPHTLRGNADENILNMIR